MDGLSAAASVIAVIQITEEVVKLCSNYLIAVKNAKFDIGRLKGELSGLKIFLKDALELLRGPNGARLETSQRLRQALERFFLQLKDLEIKLSEKLKTAKLMSRFGLRALKWPFERKDVDNIIKELSNFRDTLSASLSIDQLRLSGQTFERIDEQEQFKILRWISPILYRKPHDTVKESRTSGTCEWLLVHEKFREWENSSSSMILWLQGSPGAGKTFLTSKVIDYIETSLSTSLKEEGFAFFYCNRNEEERRKPASVLRSYVRQLSSAPGYPREMRKKLRDLWCEAQLRGMELGLEACRLQLLESVNLYAKTTFVLDALDECEPDSRRRLVETIEFLLSTSAKPIKVFISSRPDRDIRERFFNQPNIEIQATLNQGDIIKFVTEEIKKHGGWREMSPPLKEKIIRVLLERSQGMFQWVFLQIKQILDLESEEAIQDRLGKLPLSLKAAYDEIYGRIKTRNKYDKVLANSAFKWVMCAIEPLSSKELMSAIRLNPEKDTVNLHTKITESQLLHLCNNLLVIDSQRKVWRFSHLSVTEYFEENFWNLRQSHCHAAIVCLKLLIETCEEPENDRVGSSGDDETASIFNTKHPVQVYARHHWISHVQTQEGEEASPPLVGLLKNFLGSPAQSSSQYRTWFRDTFSDDRDRFGSIVDIVATKEEISPDTTPIFVMCRFSIYSLLSDWWDGPEISLSQTNIQGDSLLTLAAQAGCEPICNLLISRGLQVDLQGGVHGSALAAAVSSNRIDIVKFLVQEAKADVNMILLSGSYGSALAAAAASFAENTKIIDFLVQEAEADVNMILSNGLFGSALATAAANGNISTVECLIQNGADVNMMLQSGMYDSALAAAVSEENTEIVKCLVQHKADVNMMLQSGRYGSVLAAAAASRKMTDTVKFLVQHGAHVNMVLQSGEFGNALATAAAYGNAETVQFLVQKGGDVNMVLQYGSHGSALVAAISRGNTEIVKRLVQHKADVNMVLQYGRYGSALAAAAAYRDTKAVDCLVGYGANVNMILQYGVYGSALDAAVSQGYSEIVQLLVQHGADVNMVYHGMFENALRAAAYWGEKECVGILVNAGASVNLAAVKASMAELSEKFYPHRFLRPPGAEIIEEIRSRKVELAKLLLGRLKGSLAIVNSA